MGSGVRVKHGLERYRRQRGLPPNGLHWRGGLRYRQRNPSAHLDHKAQLYRKRDVTGPVCQGQGLLGSSSALL